MKETASTATSQGKETSSGNSGLSTIKGAKLVTTMGSTSSQVILHFADPQRIKDLNNVVQLASGGRHTIALTQEGLVFGWGDNEFGQLGLGHYERMNTTQPIQGLNNVVQIVAGNEHTLALTQDGDVWAWGKHVDDQLGSLHKKNRNVPRKIKGLNNVKQLVPRGEDSFALTHEGRVLAWGWNDKGQLDLGHHTSIQDLLQYLEDHCRKISAQTGAKAPYLSNDNGDAKERSSSCSTAASSATLFSSEQQTSASVTPDLKSIEGSSFN